LQGILACTPRSNRPRLPQRSATRAGRP
jgi:hypothetical protein